MSRSVDRLIRLVHKTGDRLIIHDPSKDRDIVIMDLDQYELLIDAQKDLEEYIDDFQAYSGQNASVQEETVPENMAIFGAPAMPPEEEASEQEPEIDLSVMSEIGELPPPLPPEPSHLPVFPSEVELESEHVSYPEDFPVPQKKQAASNWTPASALLEEKLKALTGKSDVKPVSDQEPRRIPMKDMPHMEEEYNEDDDEPIFFEEPV